MEAIYTVEPEVTGWLVIALGIGTAWVLTSAVVGTLVFRMIRGLVRLVR